MATSASKCLSWPLGHERIALESRRLPSWRPPGNAWYDLPGYPASHLDELPTQFSAGTDP
jgi:hypothetical protein